jgi:hypothetical protein
MLITLALVSFFRLKLYRIEMLVGGESVLEKKCVDKKSLRHNPAAFAGL